MLVGLVHLAEFLGLLLGLQLPQLLVAGCVQVIQLGQGSNEQLLALVRDACEDLVLCLSDCFEDGSEAQLRAFFAGTLLPGL